MKDNLMSVTGTALPVSPDDPFFVEDTIFELLSSTQSYLESQNAIGKCISSGIFSMTQARKQKGVFIAKPDDIRVEISATSFLHSNSTADPEFVLTVSENSSDIFYVCGLPPPALRTAQKEFRSCLQHILKAQQAVHHIRTIQETINPMAKQVTTTLNKKIDTDTDNIDRKSSVVGVTPSQTEKDMKISSHEKQLENKKATTIPSNDTAKKVNNSLDKGINIINKEGEKEEEDDEEEEDDDDDDDGFLQDQNDNFQFSSEILDDDENDDSDEDS